MRGEVENAARSSRWCRGRGWSDVEEMGGYGDGAGAADMEVAQEEALHCIAASELGTASLEDSKHATEGVLHELTDDVEAVVGSEVLHLKVEEVDDIVKIAGEDFVGATTLAVGVDGKAGVELVIADGNEA